MGKMKNLVIEQEVMAQILKEAVESGDYVVCDRCRLVVPADNVFHGVCEDCACDLIDLGMEREQEDLDLDELLEEIIDDLVMDKVAKDFCDMLIRDAAPAGKTLFHDTFF